MATKPNYGAAVLTLKQGLKQLEIALGLDHIIRGDAASGPSQSSVSTASLYDSTSEADLESQLVYLVGGDKAVADRLIAFEQNKSPGEDRKIYIARAIARLLKDRRA